MTHPLDELIDTILKGAEAQGEFDNLQGAGKPLPPHNAHKDGVPNRLMRESGIKPRAVSLKEQINASYARLKLLTTEDDRKAEMKTLADLQLRLSLELESLRRYG